MKKLIMLCAALAAWLTFGPQLAHAQSVESAQAAVRAIGQWSQGHSVIYQRLSELISASDTLDTTLEDFADQKIDQAEARRRIAAYRADLPLRLAVISQAIDAAPPPPDISALGPRVGQMQQLFTQIPALERRAYVQIETMANAFADMAEQAINGNLDVARASSQRMMLTAKEIFRLQTEALNISVGVVDPSNPAHHLARAQIALNDGIIVLIDCIADDPLTPAPHSLDDAHRATLTSAARTIREQVAMGRASIQTMTARVAGAQGVPPAMVRLVTDLSANLNQAFALLEAAPASFESFAGAPAEGASHEDVLNGIEQLGDLSDRLDQLAVARGELAAHL